VDPRKGGAHLAKHRFVEEAVTAFGDPLGQIIDDPRHSATRRALRAARAIPTAVGSLW